MRQITNDLNSLKEKDLINILLFCLYKLTNDKDYSVISELAFTIDKDSLYRLCSTFGGVTIKIPTMDEYENMIKLLLLFQKSGIEGDSFTEVCHELKIDDEDDIRSFYNMYLTLKPTVEDYLNEN